MFFYRYRTFTCFICRSPRHAPAVSAVRFLKWRDLPNGLALFVFVRFRLPAVYFINGQYASGFGFSVYLSSLRLSQYLLRCKTRFIAFHQRLCHFSVFCPCNFIVRAVLAYLSRTYLIPTFIPHPPVFINLCVYIVYSDFRPQIISFEF